MFRQFLLLGLVLLLSSCSEDRANTPTTKLMGLVSTQESSEFGRTLAYEHSATIDVSPDTLKDTYEGVISRCQNDKILNCTVLFAELDSSEFPQAHLRFRVAPGQAEKIVDGVLRGGTLIRRSTSVEDLAKPVRDSDKHLAMLKRQLSALESLETESKNSITDLIQITTEIAKVTTQLENVVGEREFLDARINLEILNIQLATRSNQSFWSRLGIALSSFLDDLSNGIAQAITGFAYVIPWLVIAIPTLFGFRWLWRRSK